jgi:hypothetical protein
MATTIAPGTTIHISAAGTFRALLSHTDSTFRGALIDQLLMQGFDVLTVQLETDWGVWERSYTVTIAARPLGSTSTAAVLGQVRTALEQAGSESPTVTITSAGQPAQPAVLPGVIGGTLEDLISGVGTLGGNLADLPKDLTRTVNLVVIGLVALVAFVAFGPNVGSIARAIK